MAHKLENRHVHRVYSEISTHLSDRRVKPWPRVVEFVRSFEKGSVVVDVGCGNARYRYAAADQVFMLGADRCEAMLSGCDINYGSLAADNLTLPLRDASVDGVLSIAVVHHFATRRRRLAALQELARVLRPGGRLLVYVWAYEQEQRRFAAQDVLIPWDQRKRRQSARTESTDSVDRTSEVAFDIPETAFETNDVEKPNQTNIIQRVSRLVWSPSTSDGDPPTPRSTPKLQRQAFSLNVSTRISGLSPALSRRMADWFGKTEEEDPELIVQQQVADSVWTQAWAALREELLADNFYRYYHVFRKGEIEHLIGRIEELRIIRAYKDHSNWCVIAERL